MADIMQGILNKLGKEFGDDSIIRSSDVEELKFNKTGSVNLDMALGGGFIEGRILEIYGPYMTGKTTIAILHAAEIQKEYPEGYVVFLDVERAINPNLLDAYGIVRDRFIIAKPNSAEQAFNMMERFASLENVKVVILDSIAALCPIVEVTEDNEKATMGLAARVIGKGLRKVLPVAYKSGCEIILINQLRATMSLYGAPETPPGGAAIRYFSSQMIDVRKGDPILDNNTKEQIGHTVKVKVTKNKAAVPFKNATFNLIYGVGVEKESEVADMLIESGLIVKSGGWFKFVDDEDKPIIRNLPETLIVDDNTTIALNFHGQPALVNYLKLDTDFYNLMYKMVYGEVVTLDQIRNS